MHDEIIHVYEKEEEIKLFVNKLKQFSFEDLEKTNHFDYVRNAVKTTLPRCCISEHPKNKGRSFC